MMLKQQQLVEETNKIEETSLVMPLKFATDPVDCLKTILTRSCRQIFTPMLQQH